MGLLGAPKLLPNRFLTQSANTGASEEANNIVVNVHVQGKHPSTSKMI